MSTINIDKTWLSITICTQNNYGKIPFYKNDKREHLLIQCWCHLLRIVTPESDCINSAFVTVCIYLLMNA